MAAVKGHGGEFINSRNFHFIQLLQRKKCQGHLDHGRGVEIQVAVNIEPVVPEGWSPFCIPVNLGVNDLTTVLIGVGNDFLGLFVLDAPKNFAHRWILFLCFG